jgi:hypothetical protein
MDIIIEQIDKLNEYLHLSSDLNKKDFNYFNTMLQSMRNEAINYTRCCKSDSEQLSRRPNTSSTWECFSKDDKEKKGNI